MVIAPLDDSNFVVVEIHDRPRVLENRGGVGCHEVFLLAETHEEWGAVPGGHQPVWIGSRNDGDPVGTFDFMQRSRHSVFQRSIEELLDEMRQHLGIGIRPERVAPCFEHFSECVGVFDDPVVHDSNGATAVSVRMRVRLVGDTVRRPAGVRQPDGAARHRATEVGLQVGYPSRHLFGDQASVFQDGYTC